MSYTEILTQNFELWISLVFLSLLQLWMLYNQLKIQLLIYLIYKPFAKSIEYEQNYDTFLIPG